MTGNFDQADTLRRLMEARGQSVIPTLRQRIRVFSIRDLSGDWRGRDDWWALALTSASAQQGNPAWAVSPSARPGFVSNRDAMERIAGGSAADLRSEERRVGKECRL